MSIIVWKMPQAKSILPERMEFCPAGPTHQSEEVEVALAMPTNNNGPWQFRMAANGKPYWTAVLKRWRSTRCSDCGRKRYLHLGAYAVRRYWDGNRWVYRSKYVSKAKVTSKRIKTWGFKPQLTCRCPGKRGPSAVYAEEEADPSPQTAVASRLT